MVLPGYALIAQGLQVHAAAWPGGTYTRQEVLSCAFAMQATAYVVMAGGMLRDEDIPEDAREIVRLTNGHSGIIGPSGKVIAGPLVGEEGILTAKANLGEVMLQKMVADHAGHYTRPDVFEFRVNRRPKRVAIFDDGGADEVRQRLSDGIEAGELRHARDLTGAFEDVIRGHG